MRGAILRFLEKRREGTIPKTVREFKEKAWQSPLAADTYVLNTSHEGMAMQTELEFVTKNSQGKILDVGAGTGRFSSRLALLRHEVVALDVSAAMLAKGLSDSVVPYKTVVGSAFEIPFDDNSFDTVNSIWLLIHFEEWKRVLSELIRVTKPGGMILFDFQDQAHYDLAFRLDPSISYFEERKSAGGFSAWASSEEMKVTVEEFGASICIDAPYYICHQNLVANAVLGCEFNLWRRRFDALNVIPTVGCFWQRFQESVLPNLPSGIGRSRLYAVRKHSSSIRMSVPNSHRLEVPENPCLKESIREFIRAFGPVCNELDQVF
jgi:ubiquinone/menaquinone biosynthesis C-methylase UbiE